MGTLEFILAVVSLVATGGWFVAYRSYKRKASAEADKSEAEVVQLEVDGWKAQQDVYQQTIEDLKQTCAYIREDRNLLREENKKLRDENDALREKYNEMESKSLNYARKWQDKEEDWNQCSLLRAASWLAQTAHVWSFKNKMKMKNKSHATDENIAKRT